jgi:hypothetical protein
MLVNSGALSTYLICLILKTSPKPILHFSYTSKPLNHIWFTKIQVILEQSIIYCTIIKH